MLLSLLLGCSILTIPSQRQRYEAACITEVAGTNAPAIMLKVHAERINACILAKDKAHRQHD